MFFFVKFSIGNMIGHQPRQPGAGIEPQSLSREEGEAGTLFDIPIPRHWGLKQRTGNVQLAAIFACVFALLYKTRHKKTAVRNNSLYPDFLIFFQLPHERPS